ncbi:MAG: DUF4389 domain-containing protein [Paracoccaceae bacterium]
MSDKQNQAVDQDGEEEDWQDNFTSGEVWLRGLWMLILAMLFGVAQTVLAMVAFIQFLWMLFTKERNGFLVDFGADIGQWLNAVACFQSGVTDDKPFPWNKWGWDHRMDS